MLPPLRSNHRKTNRERVSYCRNNNYIREVVTNEVNRIVTNRMLEITAIYRPWKNDHPRDTTNKRISLPSTPYQLSTSYIVLYYSVFFSFFFCFLFFFSSNAPKCLVKAPFINTFYIPHRLPNRRIRFTGFDRSSVEDRRRRFLILVLVGHEKYYAVDNANSYLRLRFLYAGERIPYASSNGVQKLSR